MKYFRMSGRVVLSSLTILAFCLSGCIKKEKNVVSSSASTISRNPTASAVKERTYYDFEKGLTGWEVPIWAMGKSDHVASGQLGLSHEIASKGSASMKIEANFPGGIWTAALVEIQQYLDLSLYRFISTDVFIPQGVPTGLKGKIILTVGNNWKFVEMSRSVALIPGEWVTISANIAPKSYDWKRVAPDRKFSEDIRKIAIRIESNRRPKYSGPIYVDNIRVGR